MHNNHNFEKLDIPLLSILFIIYESAHKMIFSLPKFERYTLGEKIENTILSAMEMTIIVSITNKLEKEKLLSQINAKIELLKILYRLTLNCQMIEGRDYLARERDLQEAGRQTMGWLKYERNAK